MKNIPVKDRKNLFRDENSHAIINTDRQAYNTYKNLREQKLKEKEDIDSSFFNNSQAPKHPPPNHYVFQ